MFKKHITFLLLTAMSAYAGKKSPTEKYEKNPKSQQIDQQGVAPEQPLAQNENQDQLQREANERNAQPVINPENQQALQNAVALVRAQPQPPQALRLNPVFQSVNLSEMILSGLFPHERLNMVQANKQILKHADHKKENFFGEIVEKLAHAKPGSFIKNYKELIYKPRNIEEIAGNSLRLKLLRKGKVFLDLRRFLHTPLTETEITTLENWEIPLQGTIELLRHERLWPFIVSLSLRVSNQENFSEEDRQLLQRFADHRRNTTEGVVNLMVGCYLRKKYAFDEHYISPEALEQIHQSFFDLTNFVIDLGIGSIKRIKFMTLRESGADSYQAHFEDLVAGNRIGELSKFSFCYRRDCPYNPTTLLHNQVIKNIISHTPHLEYLRVMSHHFIGSMDEEFEAAFTHLEHLKHFWFWEERAAEKTFRVFTSMSRHVQIEGSLPRQLETLNCPNGETQWFEMTRGLINYLHDTRRIQSLGISDKDHTPESLRFLGELVQRFNRNQRNTFDFSESFVSISNLENLQTLMPSQFFGIKFFASIGNLDGFIERLPQLPQIKCLDLLLDETLVDEKVYEPLKALVAEIKRRPMIQWLDLHSHSLEVLRYFFDISVSQIKCSYVRMHYPKQSEESAEEEVQKFENTLKTYDQSIQKQFQLTRFDCFA